MLWLNIIYYVMLVIMISALCGVIRFSRQAIKYQKEATEIRKQAELIRLTARYENLRNNWFLVMYDYIDTSQEKHTQ